MISESYSDYSSASNDHSCSMRNLAFAVARDARVVPDVLVPDVADAKLGPVVEDAHGTRRFHRIRVLIP